MLYILAKDGISTLVIKWAFAVYKHFTCNEKLVTSPQTTSFTVTATPVEDIERLSLEWCELEGRSTGHSFFLSWFWIGSWLRCLPIEAKPLILRISDGIQTQGLCIIVKGTAPVLKIFSLAQITLNATGNSKFDNISIEYNGFLAAAGLEDIVTTAGLEWLLQEGVPNQSVQLSGIDTHLTEIANSLASKYGRRMNYKNIAPAPYVDLAAIRNSGEEYLSHLSRNGRQSIRRSLRYYERIGPLEYQPALTLDKALILFEDLITTHQAYWRKRGHPGAFADPFFKQFHITLFKTAFAAGHIEMALIAAGEHPVGYLYNFIWRNTVYAYQSGFHYTDAKGVLVKPGYVSHYMAIQYALRQGRNIYDFMAGDRQHKSSLSTGKQNLAWIQLRSPLMPVKLESSIKSLRTAIYNN